MHTKRAVAKGCSIAAIVALTVFAAHAAAKDDAAVAAITKLENDAVKADLAGDKAFYEKYLADDFTAGTSFGEWENRQSMLKDLSDPKNNKVNKEEISNLKVRTHGNTAIATYTVTYDSIVRGEPRARTIIATDVFVKDKGGWKLVASHGSEAKK